MIEDSTYLSVEIDWLECKEVCLPGSETCELVIFGSDQKGKPSRVASAALKERTLEKLARPLLEGGYEAKLMEAAVELTIRHGFRTELTDLDFFPTDELVYDISQPPTVKQGLFKTRVIIPLLEGGPDNLERISGVLAYSVSGQAETIHAKINKTLKH